MPFNGTEFNKIKTKATDAKLKNLSHIYNLLYRDTPPLRGFTNKGKNEMSKVYDNYEVLMDKVIGCIPKLNISEAAKNSLSVWEEFQRNQKGPSAPITEDSVTTLIDKLTNQKTIGVSDECVLMFGKALDLLFESFGDLAKIDPSKINFEDCGKELPNQTVRGFPFHALGADADDAIIQLGGKTYLDALDYFCSQSQNVCFPGWRIQGKPRPGPAKLRVVNIPSVSYQYLMVGLTKKLMEQLKAHTLFDGGKDERRRVSNISNDILKLHSMNKLLIQLDYSAFDQNIDSRFRIMVWRKIASLFPDQEFANKFIEQYAKYNTNQYLFLGKPGVKGEGLLLNLPLQLLSGIIDTQLLGSIINATMLIVVCLESGWDVESSIPFLKALGDDALIPVSVSDIDHIGYLKVIENISKILKKYGFTVNASKSYPNSDAAFLQKLYCPLDNINGVGSFCRNIASFFFKEKHSKPIKGIKNYAALEIISQVSIISQAFPLFGTYIENYPQEFANGGVKEDKLLAGIIKELDSIGKITPFFLFETLIKISGATYEQILAHMDLLSYDHTQLSEKLHSANYAETFPILKFLCNVEKSDLLVNEDLSKLVRDANSRILVSENLDDDILDD